MADPRQPVPRLSALEHLRQRWLVESVHGSRELNSCAEFFAAADFRGAVRGGGRARLHAACSAAGRWWHHDATDQGGSVAGRRTRVLVMVMVKDAVEHLVEWVPYHLILGIHHFYIVNNDCGIAAQAYDSCDALRPYIDAGVVTLEDHAMRCPKASRAVVLGEAALRFATKPSSAEDWILKLDPDEYLVLPPGERVADFLRNHAPQIDSIVLPWKTFGTSFRVHRPEIGSVIANYRSRVPLTLPFRQLMLLLGRQNGRNQVNPYLFKDIVRVRSLLSCNDTFAAHRHLCRQELWWGAHTMGISLQKQGLPHELPLEATMGLSALVAPAWLNHYTYLSSEDWERKKLRGRPRASPTNESERRVGDVEAILSSVEDMQITKRLGKLARSATAWTPLALALHNCSATLREGDSHFFTNGPRQLGVAARKTLDKEAQATNGNDRRVKRPLMKLARKVQLSAAEIQVGYDTLLARLPKMTSRSSSWVTQQNRVVEGSPRTAIERRMWNQPGSAAGAPKYPKCSVALILSGGARDVHMTAPSIVQHLIKDSFGSSRVCVFIRALLDPDAHKLSALLNITGVRHASKACAHPLSSHAHTHHRFVVV